MYKMPVRRKLIREAIDLESMRIRLESFALIHPKVAFSLRNDRNGNMLIQTKKSSSTMATFMQLFGEERAQELAEVHHSVGPFTVSGYIGTQPHLTKALQFVYVNKRIILRTKIHKMVNDLLSRSSIISTRLHPSSVGPVKNPSSPPKGMKLYGIFVLNIECSYSEYDICLDPSKTLVEFKEWDKLLLCIEELILKFASEENLGISLDERYRRSGKEREDGEEEKEISLSQGSQSSLQQFSMKRSCKDSEVSGSSQQKYGHTLNTQDNLQAVHSMMVKRKRTENKESEVPTEEKNSINELDNDRKALRKKTNKNYCEVSSDDESKASKSPQTHNKDSDYSSPQCVEGTSEEIGRTPVEEQDMPLSHIEVSHKENNILKGTNVIEGSENDEVVSVASKRIKGTKSVLEEFERVLEELNEKDTSTEDELDLALILTENSQTECKGRERVQQNYNSLSTLEEFMDFHNREQEKSIQSGFHTPEGDMTSIPTSPPPLKSFQPSPPSPARNGVLTLEVLSERIKQSPTVSKNKRVCGSAARKKSCDFGNEEFEENSGTDTDESGCWREKKMSLSKSLGAKFKMHQNKSNTILSLHEKFVFSKIDASQSKEEISSSQSNKFTRGGRSSSGHGDSSVVALMECSKSNTESAEHEGGCSKIRGEEIEINSMGSVDCLQISEHAARSEGKRKVGREIDDNVEPSDSPKIYSLSGKADMGDGVCPDTSFKFRPVISRTFQEVDACLSHVQSCKETVQVDMNLDNQGVLGVQCTSGEGGDQNSVTISPLVYNSSRNIAGDSCESGDDSKGGSITITSQCAIACSQLTTPPRKSSALLHITENYASTPEDSDASPQKLNTPLKVPKCITFEDIIEFPQNISLQNHRDDEHLNTRVTSIPLNFIPKCGSHEPRKFTEEESRLCGTVKEGKPPQLLSEPMISNDSFQMNESHRKFQCRRGYHKEVFIACKKDDLNNSSEEEGRNFKDSGFQTTSGSVPITQSFEVNYSLNQQRLQDREQEDEELHHLPSSQGFTPPNSKSGFVPKQNASIDESFLPKCSSHAQVPRSDEILNDIVKPRELTREMSENQEPGSIMLISHNQTSQEDAYLENTLSLPSQVIMENDLININVGQQLSSSDKRSLQTQTQVLSHEGVALSEKPKGRGKVTSESELISLDHTFPNPLYESLHFSQLTLPDDEDNEPSHHTSLSLDSLPAILTDSLSIPSSMSEDIGTESKMTPPCVSNFQVNQTKYRKLNIEAGVDETKHLHKSGLNMHATTKTGHVLGSCENIVHEITSELPSHLSPQAQSFDIVPSIENSNSVQNISPFKDSSSWEEGSDTDSSINKESGLCKNPTLRQLSSCQNTPEQMEMHIPPHGCHWRETVDKDGRIVYVNLQTGNSSYEPPEMKDMPEWTSTQPLGARLPRVPLTHEPWYIPRDKAHRERNSFTLSHGFKEFKSWKKTIEMRKESLKQVANNKKNSSDNVGTKNTALTMSQEIQDAIVTLMEDCEVDESVKWLEKPEPCLYKPSQTLEVAQICQMWEPPDLAMDAEVLNSGPDAATAPKSVAGVRVYNMVHPYRFSRDMLSSCKVRSDLIFPRIFIQTVLFGFAYF